MAYDYQTRGCNQYGASMGRTSDLPKDFAGALQIRRVPLDDGGYDPGGAYWGTGQPLYCVWNDEGGTAYLRATDIVQAQAQFPKATWAPFGGPTAEDLDDMVEAYLETVLYAETDNADDSGGEPLDANYSTADFTKKARAQARKDCQAFIKRAGDILTECMGKRGPYGKTECDWAQAGRDLWFSRNGHGVGFWDGDWPKPHGDALHAAAKKMGGAYVDIFRGKLSLH